MVKHQHCNLYCLYKSLCIEHAPPSCYAMKNPLLAGLTLVCECYLLISLLNGGDEPNAVSERKQQSEIASSYPSRLSTFFTTVFLYPYF